VLLLSYRYAALPQLNNKEFSTGVENAFYFSPGGSCWPSQPLSIGMSARSILHTLSMVPITSFICSFDSRTRVEVIRVIEPAAPTASPRLPDLA